MRRPTAAILSLALASCTLAPPVGSLDTTTEAGIGIDPKGAPLRITVFSDYGCAPCGTIVRTVNELLPLYQGRVVLTLRDFITPQINPGAYRAALAARCAGEQGKQDAYAQLAFGYAGDWKTIGDDVLTSWGNDVKLDVGSFGTCLKEKRPADAILGDLRDAKLLNVVRTPVIFLGSVRVDDPGTPELWRALIDDTLRGGVQNSTQPGGSAAPSVAPSSTSKPPTSSAPPSATR